MGPDDLQKVPFQPFPDTAAA